MRISIQSTVLADPSLALGRVGPSNLSVNGQQIIDEADFFRADAPTFFQRGSAGVVLQFAVERNFSSLAAAESFVLLHRGAVPLEGLVTCECGDGDTIQTAYLREAVVEAVLISSYRGRSVVVQYTIRGGQFESDIPPEEIPGEPEPGEEFVVLRRGKVAIAADAETVEIVFSSPLSGVPVVTVGVSRPAGGDVLRATVDEDSITVNGFTVQLSAAAPDGTHKLNYVAIE